jgi:hypothetical protein
VVRGVGEVVNSAQSHQTPASARISDIEDLALFRQLPTSPGFDVCVGDGCGEVYGYFRVRWQSIGKRNGSPLRAAENQDSTKLGTPDFGRDLLTVQGRDGEADERV